ncbi:MAG: UDP-N-acetylmuramoyl-L-alanyl-D-glutamate--2,6-diaminopimelate ligase [Microgenomates group bacterium]|jgi:UDP-N-acetylmuramoyl-L-alanyl-D-glutamate--2,6-diaminopimelate ligase
MTIKLRKFIPHSFVNYGKHLPKAVVASVRHGFPGKKLHVIGVTGTDGKTTTVNMIYQILKAAGKKVSMISTINAEIGGKSYDTGLHVTSPEASDIQKFMKKSLENGDEYMVLEVSSHALEQFRVWSINFEIGVITNITSDHLDYHGSLKNYIEAKSKLIKNVKWAILNKDDSYFEILKKMTSGKILTFPSNLGLNLKIIGDFNILNAEAAFLVGRTLDIDEKLIKNTLENFAGLVGRMEEIDNELGIKIFVDFATNQNALENALTALRKQTKGKLIALFGVPSERDSSKRPLMGEVSAKLADITVLTEDDPRFEDKNKIIEEIAEGYYKIKGKNDKNLYKEPNRQKAIQIAIDLAKRGDVVGLFGKGHEKSMSYQGLELPWSDSDAVKEVIWKKK